MIRIKEKLKEVYANLISNKGFTFKGVLLFLGILFLLGSTYPIATYNEERAFIYNAQKKGVKSIALKFNNEFPDLNYADAEKLCGKLDLAKTINGGVFSAAELVKLGCEFYSGYEEITSDGVYVADSWIDSNKDSLYYDKECTLEVNEEIKLEDLVGKYLINLESSRICGVFKKDEASDAISNFYMMPKDFTNESRKVVDETLGYDVYVDDLKLEALTFAKEIKKPVLGNNIVYNDASSLAEQECFIPLALYNEMFNESNKFSYYYSKDNPTKPLHTPSHLGEEITIKLADGDYKFIEKSYKVAGIYDSSLNNMLIVKNNDEYFKYSSSFFGPLFIEINSEKFNDINLLINEIKNLGNRAYSDLRTISIQINYLDGTTLADNYYDDIMSKYIVYTIVLIVSCVGLFIAVILYTHRQQEKYSSSFSTAALGSTAVLLMASIPATLLSYLGAIGLERLLIHSEYFKHILTPEGCYGYLVVLGIVVLGFITAYGLCKLLPRLKKNHFEMKNNN